MGDVLPVGVDMDLGDDDGPGVEETSLRPEERLVIALLELSVREACGRGVPWKVQQAKLWLFSQNNAPWSFLWCCLQVNVRPGVLRTRVLERAATLKYPRKTSRMPIRFQQVRVAACA